MELAIRLEEMGVEAAELLRATQLTFSLHWRRYKQRLAVG